MKTNFDLDEIMVKYRPESAHKVRVIHYDPIDMVHICSVDPNLLKEKYFSLVDVNPGDLVTAEVGRKMNDGRYEVHVGSLKGKCLYVVYGLTTQKICEYFC